MSHTMKIVSAAVAGLLASTPAFATNGYALHGIGMKAKGMVCSIAFPQDGVSIGQNPAASAVVGNRLDVGIDVFRPIRETKLSDTGFSCSNPFDPTTCGPAPGLSTARTTAARANGFSSRSSLTARRSTTRCLGHRAVRHGGMNTDYGSRASAG